MKAYRNWNQTNPFLLPGVKQRTGVTGQFPIKCEKLVKFTDGTSAGPARSLSAGT